MDEKWLLNQLHAAFDSEDCPKIEDIIHCSYDKRWGGTLDGPCRECSEVVDYFNGKGQYQHNPIRLGWVAFGLNSFTPEAFIYWLPAFIEAAILHPKEADSALESLEFRFESLDSVEWQDSHIGKLSRDQLDVLKNFFQLQHRNRKNEVDQKVLQNIMATLEKYSS
jgi:hypothetical protein